MRKKKWFSRSGRERLIDIYVPDWIEWTVSFVLVYTAFTFLRLQLVTDLDLTYSEALSRGLFMGLVQDFLAVLLPLSLSMILSSLFRFPRRITWSILSFAIWIVTMANVMYFKFFGDPLYLWVLQTHWKDLTSIQGATTNLALAVPILLSALMMAVSIAFTYFSYHRLKGKKSPELEQRHRREIGIGGVIVLIFVVVLRNSPDWLRRNFHESLPWAVKGTVLSDQILTLWWDQVYDRERWFRAFGEASRESVTKKDSEQRLEVQKVLAQYRDYKRAASVSSSRPDWPLLYRISHSGKESAATRRLLGLPTSGPVNVVMLFIESGRYFEIGHPKTAQKVWPKLNRLMREKSISFSQTYTAARGAAQSDRGMFSTNCSWLPNIEGPATFLIQPNLKIKCIQEVLSAEGYITAWSHSYPSNYQNMGYFETHHGTQLLFGREHFLSVGIEHRKDDWGIEDGPFLDETLKIMKDLRKRGKGEKPFFISALTASSHYPWSIKEDSQLDPALTEEVREHPDYHGYLTRLKYVDETVVKFVNDIFSSELGDNTLIVILADHSTNIRSPFAENPRSIEEARFRIPLMFVTKNLKQPEIHSRPVHQMDIIPTIARIAGVKDAEVAWLGRDLFAGEGTPWTYLRGSQLLYRVGSQACYTPEIGNQIRCYRVGELQDPMLNGDGMEELEAAREIPTETRLLEKVIHTNTTAIREDLIFP